MTIKIDNLTADPSDLVKLRELIDKKIKIIDKTETSLIPINEIFDLIPSNEIGIINESIIKLSKHLDNFGKTNLKKIILNQTKKIKTFGIKLENFILSIETNNETIEKTFEYDLIRKYFDKNTWDFLAKNVRNESTIINSQDIKKILRNSGTEEYYITKALDHFVETDTIPKMISVYIHKYDFNDKKFYFPHNYFSNNVTGHGIEFYERYYSENKNITEGKDAYLNILESARKGIGDINALIISAFSIASPFSNYFKKKNRIIGQLLLVGDIQTAKTTTAEYLGNIAKVKILHEQGELTPAIFTQMGSMATIPMIIDDVQELHNDIVVLLKVVLTGDAKRRRSTSEGGRRDAPEIIRTFILTANGIPEFIETKTALLDRTIILKFDNIPSNNVDWKKVQIDFDKCNSSILNYLVHTNGQIDYEKIAEESKIESISIKNIRKQGIYAYILFGLKILEQLGVQYNDSIKEQLIKCITFSNSIGLEERIDQLDNFCNQAYHNYCTWITVNTPEAIARMRNNPKGIIETFSKTYNGVKKDFFAISNTQLKIFTRINNIKDLKNLSDLEIMIKSAQIDCKKYSVRLQVFAGKVTRCLLIDCRDFNPAQVLLSKDKDEPKPITDFNPDNLENECKKLDMKSIKNTLKILI